MMPPLVIYGDWRDTRAALEKAVPQYGELPEAERERAWKLVTAFVEHYAPLRATCIECGTIMSARAAYRCADCHAHLCERCIRPHFEGRLSPPKGEPGA